MNLELFTIGFVAALTPGPDILLITQTTLNNSFREGLKTLCGVLSGNTIMIGILVIGFSSIGKSLFFQMSISLFGGFYLLYVAHEIFKHRREQIKARQSSVKTFYLNGLYVNLSNPKAIIFFSAILAPFLGVGSIFFNVISLFVGIVLAFLFAVALTEILRENLLTQRAIIIINTFSSTIFFIFSFELFFNFYNKAVVLFNL